MRDVVELFRRAKSNKLFVAGFFVLAVTLTGVGAYQFNQTDVEAADCRNQTNNIVPQGTYSYGDITQHYNANTCGDVKAIFDHYWIKPTVAPGDRVVEGTANNRGEIVAEGRVVATNATSIGRQPIQHSRPISIAGKTYYETSHVGGHAFANPGGSLQALVVLDAHGNFKNAIIKDCGNPVYAKPVPPPKPPVKDIQVCDIVSRKIVTIKEDQFNPQQHSRNLDDCKDKMIKVCLIESKEWVTINEREFDATRHSTNPQDCEDVKIQVCDLKTKTIITINEDQFDAKKHSRNFEDCKVPEKIVVCDLETKQVVSIEKDEFDKTRHSTNLDDCKQPTPVTPTTPAPPKELPKTGATDLIGAGIGLTAMGLSAYYYAVSRRLF